MSVNCVYDTWLRRIRQLRPRERITRVRNFAQIATGILKSKSVHLSGIASKIPGAATQPSKARRIRRFLSNDAIDVREWYAPVARDVLQDAVDHGLELRLLTDGTKVGFGHQLLMIALACRKRAIPIAWTWVKGTRGHSSAAKQIALLSYVRQLLPADATVVICGDSEFGAVAVLKQLAAWGWRYVMRQKGDILVQEASAETWRRFDSLVEQGAPARWIPHAQLTQKHGYRVNLMTWWKPGEKQPWLLATNLPTLRATRRTYPRRMWIEEMFGDFKQHGFDLESTHLRHPLRLSRLTLIVAFLYVWLVAFGSYVIKRGLRRLVDRADRKDLSIFRIGLDMVERLLTNEQPLVMRLIPYFS